MVSARPFWRSMRRILRLRVCGVWRLVIEAGRVAGDGGGAGGGVGEFVPVGGVVGVLEGESWSIGSPSLSC